jgi:hypothetical protein
MSASKGRASYEQGRSKYVGSTWPLFPLQCIQDASVPLIVLISEPCCEEKIMLHLLVVYRMYRLHYRIYKTRKTLVIYRNTTIIFVHPCLQSLSTKEMGNTDEEPGEVSDEDEVVLLCME